MLIFNSLALSLCPCDDEMSVLQPVRFYTRYPLQLFPGLNFPGNLPVSVPVFWEAFVFLLFIVNSLGLNGQHRHTGASFSQSVEVPLEVFPGKYIAIYNSLSVLKAQLVLYWNGS